MTKDFELGDFVISARMNLLNAFNYANYSTFNILGVGSNGVLDPDLEVNQYGDSFYVPRTFNFEVSVAF